MQSQFKSILTYRELDGYLEYQYLSCPCSGLEKKEDQAFSILDLYSVNKCKICHERVRSMSKTIVLCLFLVLELVCWSTLIYDHVIIITTSSLKIFSMHCNPTFTTSKAITDQRIPMMWSSDAFSISFFPPIKITIVLIYFLVFCTFFDSISLENN
jgi:hypothetical protein